ncbi:MAG: LuxR C-terminal-related transcriptional regulator [bacterium]
MAGPPDPAPDPGGAAGRGGGSNDDIAAELGIAPRTVARLLQETFLRLEVSNRTALAASAPSAARRPLL